MAGVRIVTDSACDLPQDLVDRHGIGIVPLTIRFGDEELVDRIDLSASDFYKKMASTSDLPQTAAPSPGAFEEAFTRMADEGAEAVVCVNL
jgi:DegV family protein with EDD domain